MRRTQSGKYKQRTLFLAGIYHISFIIIIIAEDKQITLVVIINPLENHVAACLRVRSP